MSQESLTGSVGSQDPMEPPQNTETATDQGPLPSTGPAGGGPPSEKGPEAGAPEEEQAMEEFDALAADLQLSLDELDISRPEPIEAPDRRAEMTPGRVVHFGPAAATPDSGGSKLGFGSRARPFSMSPLTSTGER
eukprot:2582908-Rhodomonas_salina.1